MIDAGVLHVTVWAGRVNSVAKASAFSHVLYFCNIFLHFSGKNSLINFVRSQSDCELIHMFVSFQTRPTSAHNVVVKIIFCYWH